jgi:hypothetical protein
LVYCSDPASMQPTFALTCPAEKSNAAFATDSESRVPVMRNVDRLGEHDQLVLAGGGEAGDAASALGKST